MNKKIKKYLDEIAKTEKKIADLQQYLRGVQAALKQEEDNEMIRCIRGMKMENDQLYDLLDGIQKGTPESVKLIYSYFMRTLAN